MPKTQRQHFRVLSFKTGGRPKTLIMELREYAIRWLKPATQGERKIVNKVVLEHVGYAIPPAVCTWLMQFGPTSLEQVATCLENYILAEKTNASPDWGTPEKSPSKGKLAGPGPASPPMLYRQIQPGL